MTPTDALKIAIDALHQIASCPEESCERYVAKVDTIAVEALARIEAGEVSA